MKHLHIILFGLLLSMPMFSRPFKIIANNDPTISTHTLRSGKLTLGFTDFGGGMINAVIFPEIGDITAVATKKYGRGCQTSIRDEGHGQVYNPTQAGFNETLGTECTLTQTPGKIVVEPRGCALWYGDGKYDFTEWENIGPDFTKTDGGNSDQDGLDETNLVGKQETEVFSEFDFYATYEDYVGKHGIKTACVRHYAEFRFVRSPGHCLNQFSEGTPLFRADKMEEDISVEKPVGIHKATDKDLSAGIMSFFFRNDTIRWRPNYRHLQRVDGTWEVQNRNNSLVEGKQYNKIVIISDSVNIESAKAFGLYCPSSKINLYPIIGVNTVDNSIIYEDARTTLTTIGDYPTVARPAIGVYGIRTYVTGMINPDRLEKGTNETYRAENYILYGTPKEIMDAIKAIDKFENRK